MAYPAQKYVDLRNRLRRIVAYLLDESTGLPTARATELGYQPQMLANLAAATTVYETVFANYSDFVQRGPLRNAQMLAEYNTINTGILRQVVNLARGSPVANAEDGQVIGFKLRSGGNTPAPTPTTTVTLTMVKPAIGMLTYQANEQTPEGANRTALPKKFRLQIEQAITDTAAPPVDLAEFHLAKVSGKSRFDLPFDAADKGRYVHVRARFINTLQETGPWSNIRSNLIL